MFKNKLSNSLFHIQNKKHDRWILAIHICDLGWSMLALLFVFIFLYTWNVDMFASREK